jgi:hypothetical protein
MRFSLRILRLFLYLIDFELLIGDDLNQTKMGARKALIGAQQLFATVLLDSLGIDPLDS